MFSILVSELTAEMLSKAEYWKIYGVSYKGEQWSDVRHRNRLDTYVDESGKTIFVYWGGVQALSYDPRCFPVSMTPDGTETRLECPRMPDEVEIDGPIGDDFDVIKGMDASGIYNGRWDWYWPRKGTAFCLHSLRPPTPEHSPRLALEGMWVWSTRK